MKNISDVVNQVLALKSQKTSFKILDKLMIEEAQALFVETIVIVLMVADLGRTCWGNDQIFS